MLLKDIVNNIRYIILDQKMKLQLITMLILFPTLSLAAPNISAIEGIIKDGEKITISGSDFGTKGPNIILFDDFSDGAHGNTWSNSEADIGSWERKSGKGFSDPKLSNDMGSSHVGLDNESNLVSYNAVEDNVFMSSYVYIPDGYFFPDTNSEETFGDSANMKFFWQMYTATGYKHDDNLPDMWTPGMTWGHWQGTNSNDGLSDYRRRGTGDKQWTWDEPVKWAFWFKANGTSPKGTRQYNQAVSSSGHTFYENHEAHSWFKESYDDVYGFDRLSIPGYIRESSISNTQFVIDDVYVATGAGAAARVEIGNKPNYKDCTKLAIITPTSWNSTTIKAVVREGIFKKGEQAYFFVIDAKNHISDGYSITYGKELQNFLEPPTNIYIHYD